jgi:hypothetical protein
MGRTIQGKTFGDTSSKNRITLHYSRKDDVIDVEGMKQNKLRKHTFLLELELPPHCTLKRIQNRKSSICHTELRQLARGLGLEPVPTRDKKIPY